MSCEPKCNCNECKYYDKSMVVGSLMHKLYEGKLNHLTVESSGLIDVVFTNKPNQQIQLQFTPHDKWNHIKTKVDKLIKSDGNCVVCYEKEKSVMKIERVPCKDCNCGHTERKLVFKTNVGICQSCCEYVCIDCYKKMNGTKCPVCRECLLSYKHKYKGEECHCNDDDDD